MAGFLLVSSTTWAQTPEADLFVTTAKRPAEREPVSSDLALRQRYVTVRTDVFFEDS